MQKTHLTYTPLASRGFPSLPQNSLYPVDACMDPRVAYQQAQQQQWMQQVNQSQQNYAAQVSVPSFCTSHQSLGLRFSIHMRIRSRFFCFGFLACANNIEQMREYQIRVQQQAYQAQQRYEQELAQRRYLVARQQYEQEMAVCLSSSFPQTA